MVDLYREGCVNKRVTSFSFQTEQVFFIVMPFKIFQIEKVKKFTHKSFFLFETLGFHKNPTALNFLEQSAS